MNVIQEKSGGSCLDCITNAVTRRAVQDLVNRLSTTDGNIVALDMADVRSVLNVTDAPVVSKGVGETPIGAAARALHGLCGAPVEEGIVSIVAGEDLMLKDAYNIVEMIIEGADVSDMPFGVIVEPGRKNCVEVTILAAIRKKAA